MYLLFLLTLLGVSPLPAQRQIYVSPNGDDDQDGHDPWDHAKLTIGAALAVVNPNPAGLPDVVNVAEGTYAEAVTITKPVSLVGIGETTVIAPPPGSTQGISIQASNVEIASLAVTHASQNGIYIDGVSNVRLTNLLCEADTLDGVLMSNVSNIRLTNVTARFNQRHGLNIGDGSHDVLVNGGAFTSNGRGGFLTQTGAGVNIYSDTKATSFISFQGTQTFSGNTTTGLWISSPSLVGRADSISFMDGDTARFEDNAESAIVVYGNTNHITLRGKFVKQTTTSAGIVLAGYDTPPECSPRNTSIFNSVFSGYDTSGHPAITLSTGWIGKYSPNDALCTYCRFLDATKNADIPYFVYDKRKESRLGQVTLIGSQALPVELRAFRVAAREESVEIAWETATEVDNAGFDIERSTPNTDAWSKIAFISGQGTSQLTTQYGHVDHPPPKGEYRYRLKQIDNDGNFKYSRVLSVSVAPKKPKMTILENFPNPFNPETTFRLTLAEAGHVTATMFSLLGAKIETLFDGLMESGIHEMRWRAGMSLAGGTYFCVLRTGNTTNIRRIVLLR